MSFEDEEERALANVLVELEEELDLVSPMGDLFACPTGSGEERLWEDAGLGGFELIPDEPRLWLGLVEQPVERCRFRYKAEQGPHGSLRSAVSDKRKSCPRVRFYGLGREELGRAYVRAELFTTENPPRPHVHDLWGSDCTDGICTVPVDPITAIASFPNLGIMRQKEKELGGALLAKLTARAHHINEAVSEEELRVRAEDGLGRMKDCLHTVRIGFQGFIPHPSGDPALLKTTPLIMSEPICNSQNAGFTALKIAQLSRSSGTVLGGDELWIRCAAKVRRDQVKVVFSDSSKEWEAEGVFTHNDVHEQILIILRTPAYRDPRVREPVEVQVHLARTSDNAVSDPLNFLYLPVADVREPVEVQVHLARTSDNAVSDPLNFLYLPVADGPPKEKRARIVPAFEPSSFAFSLHPHQTGTTHQADQPTTDATTAFSPNPDAFPPPDSGFESLEKKAGSGGVEREGGFSLTALREALSGAPETQGKVETVLGRLWEAQLHGLWLFAAEGDAGALAAASRHLLHCPDPDGNTALHLSVRNRQPFALKTLLGTIKGSDEARTIINSTNLRKQTALHLAVRFSDAESLHYLIAAGAKRAVMDADGNSPAHFLCETFAEDIYRDVLQPPENTAAGSEALELNTLNNNGEAALHRAVRSLKLGLVEALLEAKAGPDTAERSTGKRPLHLAVEMGDLDALRLLLASGATVDAPAHDGSTPLHWAVLYRQEPLILELVKEGASPDAKTAAWQPRSDPSAEGDQPDVVEGEATELCSARDLAGDNERLQRLLNGEELENLSQPNELCRPRPPMETAGSRLPRSLSRQPQPDDLPPMPAIEPRPFDDLDPPTSHLQDDLGSLDFVTRLRLSKLLDDRGRWEKVAQSLGCLHMVDLIKASIDAESGSPTVLLLDQYEGMPGSSITMLTLALAQCGEKEAEDLIQSRKPHFADLSSGTGTGGEPGAEVAGAVGGGTQEPPTQIPDSPPPPLDG